MWVLLADEVAGLHLPPSTLVSTPALTLDVIDPKAKPLYRDGAANYLLCYKARTSTLTAAQLQPDQDIDDADVAIRLCAIDTPLRAVDEHDAVGTRLLLTDERVNIYEFRLAAGQSCNYHQHGLPYCFVNLSSSLTQALDENADAIGPPAFQSAGQCTWVNEEELSAHGVFNVGDTEFLQFVVESKHLAV